MDEKKIRNRLDYAFFTASVLSGIACAYVAKNGLDLTSLSEGVKVGATMCTALASSFALQIASLKPENKIISYLKKKEDKQRADSIFEEVKKNPDKYRIIEFNRSLQSNIRESFKSKDECMQVELYGKNGSYLTIWSSSCRIIDQPEKDKISIVVLVDSTTTAKFVMLNSQNYMLGLENCPSMKIRMDTIKDRDLFLSKFDTLVKGFYKGEFPSDKSIPFYNFLVEKSDNTMLNKQNFSLEKSNSVKNSSLLKPKNNEVKIEKETNGNSLA